MSGSRPVARHDRDGWTKSCAKACFLVLVSSLAGGLESLLAQTPPPISLDAEWAWADYPPTAAFPSHTTREMVSIGGTLWLRTDRSVHRFDGFRWRLVGEEDGLPVGLVTGLAAIGATDALIVVDGRLYRGDADGFAGVDLGVDFPDEWRVVRAVADADDTIFITALPLSESDTPHAFLYDGETTSRLETVWAPRNLWASGDRVVFLHRTAGLSHWEGGEWRTDVPATVEYQSVSSFDNTTSGSALVAVGDVLSGWHLSELGGAEERNVPIEGNDAVQSATRTKDGWILAAHENGRVRAHRGDEWVDVPLPPGRRTGVHFVRSDPTGDLWLGSEAGLHLYRRSVQRWRGLTYPGLDPRNRVNDVLVRPNGELWVATHDGITRWQDGAEIEWIRTIDGERLGPVTTLAADSSGGVWVGSGAMYVGAARWLDGTWERLGRDEGWEGGRIHSINVTSDGAVWFATLGNAEDDHATAGFYRYDGGPIERWIDPDSVLATRAYALDEGADGSLWFGTRRGMAQWKNGGWTSWGAAEGLGQASGIGSLLQRVFTVQSDGEGGAWFGYGPNVAQGLGHVLADGTLVHFSVTDGLPDDAIKEVARNAEGEIWVSTSRGIARLVGGEWAAFDGTTGLDPANAWPLAFDDGSVIVGTTLGVQILDLSEESHPAPQVRLLNPVTVEGGRVRAQWDVQAFRGEITPARIQVRHRIDNRPWGPWESSRDLWVTTDSADIDWGRHTMSHQAMGLHGQLSEPLTVSFVVPFPVVLRPVFLGPVGALTAMLFALGLQFRSRRVRTDHELRSSERRFRSLVDSAPDAIAILDIDSWRFTGANRSARQLLGLDLAGRTVSTLTDLRIEDVDALEQAPALEVSIERALAGQSLLFEWTLQSPDGPVPVEVRLSRFPGEGKRLVRFSMLDVRDRQEAERHRHELEARLRQSQRIEAIGQLTGGVAHDFNNLLTVISGNLELLLLDLDDDPAARELATGALEAADRSGLLTSRLLAFSRKQALQSQSVDVVKLVSSLLDLLARSLGETIDVQTTFEAGCPPAFVDRGQLENALVNLAVNARDAMPDGGTLSIVVESTLIDEAAATAAWEVAPGSFVSVGISDTGTGMTEEVMSKVFDPFFTTKEVGRGSGLGLSMVYGFVRQTGGLIRIRSAPGEGSTIELFLPVSDRPEVSRERTDQPRVLAQGRGETILVVEDEPQVLEFTTRLCNRLGYRTIQAVNGPDAIEILESDATIDLLLSDVVLPGGINGVDLAGEARRIRPDLPVLLTSGYAEQPVLERARAMTDVGFVSKPFDTTTLADRLRERLEA